MSVPAPRNATMGDAAALASHWAEGAAVVLDHAGIAPMTLATMQDNIARGWRAVIDPPNHGILAYRPDGLDRLIEFWHAQTAASFRAMFLLLADLGIAGGWGLIKGTVWSTNTTSVNYLAPKFTTHHNVPPPDVVLAAYPNVATVRPTPAQIAALPHYIAFSATPALIKAVA